jgi:hypothetical protein
VDDEDLIVSQANITGTVCIAPWKICLIARAWLWWQLHVHTYCTWCAYIHTYILYTDVWTTIYVLYISIHTYSYWSINNCSFKTFHTCISYTLTSI